jgi:hypothetical protein
MKKYLIVAEKYGKRLDFSVMAESHTYKTKREIVLVGVSESGRKRLDKLAGENWEHFTAIVNTYPLTVKGW